MAAVSISNQVAFSAVGGALAVARAAVSASKASKNVKAKALKGLALVLLG